MIVRKQVDVSTEVEVGIGLDDIKAVLAESAAEAHSDDAGLYCWRQAISDAVQFLVSVPDGIIAQFGPEPRQIIQKHLREQADRYGAPAETERSTK